MIDRIKVEKLPQAISVTVKTPEQILFEGQAVAITSVNKDGVFDVIPYHTNFISIISQYVIIQKTKNDKITIPIQGGIMKVYGNLIHIFLGIKTSN